MSRGRARGLFVALAMLGYVIVSRKLGEQYPFGPLTMFSEGLRVASRIVAKAPDGRVCELAAFEGWQCEGEIDFHAAAHPQCRIGAEHAEGDRKAESLLRAGVGANGENTGSVRVQVLRRSFQVERTGGPIEVEDCPLVVCHAKEVAGACVSTR